MLNLTAPIRFHARRTPDRIAVVHGGTVADGTRIGYAELDDRIGRMAGWLARQGIGRGDVVALCMKNSTAFIEIAHAVSHLGAVLLPINYRLAADEVSYILGHAGARLLLADEELMDGPAAAAAAIVTAVHALGPAAQADGRVLAGRDTPVPPPSPCGPDDLYRLMYTSGTTDRPKGVIQTYGNYHFKNLDVIAGIGLTGEDRLPVAGPLYHVGGSDLPGYAAFTLGGALAVLRDFDAGLLAALVEREGLTGAWLAPTMTNMLLALPEQERRRAAGLRWVIGGGERTPESRIRAFAEALPRTRYVDAFGMTETVSGDTMMEAGMELAKIGSVGRPLAHVAVTIRDEAGVVLPADREGEICLAGPKVTQGYWQDPERTAASFHGRWLRSGDVGYLDGDGFLYLTDRKKDMILSGGENIASSEVERVVYEMPAVHEAAVIARPDPRWGERPVVVAVPRPGHVLDLAALQAHCRAKLAGFKVPKELFLVDALPRNPSGKVLKRVLRERFAAAGNSIGPEGT